MTGTARRSCKKQTGGSRGTRPFVQPRLKPELLRGFLHGLTSSGSGVASGGGGVAHGLASGFAGRGSGVDGGVTSGSSGVASGGSGVGSGVGSLASGGGSISGSFLRGLDGLFLLGAAGEDEGGKGGSKGDLCVHFGVPRVQWWDDVEVFRQPTGAWSLARRAAVVARR